MPAREIRCHCGCDRAVAEAKEAADRAEAAGDGIGRRALLIVVLLAAAGLVVFAAVRQRSKDVEAAAREKGQRTQPSGPPVVPSTGPPPVYGDLRTGGSYASPPTYVYASPSVEPSPVLLPPSPKPSESPTLSTMEEEWERASTLLEGRLQKIAADSTALEASYYPFAAQCLPPGAGGSGPGGWLFALKSAPVVGGVLFVDGNIDCTSARSKLMVRANQVKAELGSADELGRTNRVLPGHWRKLLASHQLDMWDQY